MKKKLPNQSRRRYRTLGLIAVLGLSLTINVVGLTWGSSGFVSWQPDSIEGMTAVGHVQHLFSKWTHKYPRGQFLINGIFYYPLLKYWQQNPLMAQPHNGTVQSQILTLPRLQLLVMITRSITIVMSLGIVLAVYKIAFLLFGGYLEALLSALTIALSQLFVFYSSAGCVDIPYIFWFTWAFYWAIKAVTIGKWHHYLWLGFFCAGSFCTKESAFGYILGLAPAMWILAAQHAIKKNGKPLGKSILAVFKPSLLITVITFLICFLILNGFLAGPREFMDRVSSWGKVVDGFDIYYQGQFELLCRSAGYLWPDLGWPLLTLLVIAVVYAAIRYPVKLIVAIAPLLCFYVFIVMRIHFNAPRFLLGGYPAIALLIGKFCADFLRSKRIPALCRWTPIILAYALSLMYCLALNMELLHDTRIRTENWFKDNVPPNTLIGAQMKPIYSPRLQYQGYRQICHWNSHGTPTSNGEKVFFPPYLIVSNSWPCTSPVEDKEFRKELFAGRTPYQQVAFFQPQYLYPAKSIWGLAGWPFEKHKRISPTIYIFQRKNLPQADKENLSQ